MVWCVWKQRVTHLKIYYTVDIRSENSNDALQEGFQYRVILEHKAVITHPCSTVDPYAPVQSSESPSCYPPYDVIGTGFHGNRVIFL